MKGYSISLRSQKHWSWVVAREATRLMYGLLRHCPKVLLPPEGNDPHHELYLLACIPGRDYTVWFWLGDPGDVLDPYCLTFDRDCDELVCWSLSGSAIPIELAAALDKLLTRHHRPYDLYRLEDGVSSQLAAISWRPIDIYVLTDVNQKKEGSNGS